MKISELDILIIPGWENSGEAHWQTRWEQKMPTAKRVEQKAWNKPHRTEWVGKILQAIEQAERPVFLIAHSLGTLAVAHAAAEMTTGKVRGALLVAPPEETRFKKYIELPKECETELGSFFPPPNEALPFPSMLVASTSDHYMPIEEAEALAKKWGATFVDAGDAGHINTESGFGPWPEGLMRLALFLREL